MLKAFLIFLVLGAIALVVIKLTDPKHPNTPTADDAENPHKGMGIGKGMGVGVTLTLLGTILFWSLFDPANPTFAWIIHNPVIAGGLYVVIGVVWMWLKWTAMGMRHVAKHKALKAEFARKMNIDANAPVPQHLWADWDRFAHPYSRRLLVRNYKVDLMLWIGYWPFSMAINLFQLLGYLIHGPSRKALSGLLALFGKGLQNLADWQSRKNRDDMRD